MKPKPPMPPAAPAGVAVPSAASTGLPWLVGLALCAIPALGNDPHPLPDSSGGTSTEGPRLLVQYQCGSCHVVPGVMGAGGTLGPTLAAFGSRSYIAGEIPNTPELRARWIVAPAALVPGTPMPAMGVSLADARTIAAYLSTLE